VRRYVKPSGCGSRSSRPGGLRGPGNLQAWAREVRYGAAERLARGSRPRSPTGHTADDQVDDDPLPAGLLAEPPGAARHASPRRAPGAAAARLHTGPNHRLLRGAPAWHWREDSSNDEPAYARNRVRHGLAVALAEIHPAAAANVLRTAALLRDEAEVLDALVASELEGSAGVPPGSIALERLAGLPRALRRLVVQQLADRAAGKPVAGAARHAEDVAALRRTGNRDARPGLRGAGRGRARHPARRALRPMYLDWRAYEW